jgi:amidase
VSHHDRPIHALTATELAAAIRRGDLTSTAVCEHYLARIAGLNPTINAYTRVLADEARAAGAR